MATLYTPVICQQSSFEQTIFTDEGRDDIIDINQIMNNFNYENEEMPSIIQQSPDSDPVGE